MALIRRWFHPEPEPSEGELIAFRRQLLLFLAVFTFYGAWMLITWIITPSGLRPKGMLVLLCGTCLALATYLLRRDWPRLGGWLFVLGALGLSGLLFATFHQPLILGLVPLIVVLAGLLLGKAPQVLVAATASLMIVRLNPGALEPYATALGLGLVAAACGIGLVTSQALHLIDYFERELVLRQRALVEQLRERQGELNRTLKALDEAYVSLKRMNDELIIARQRAEEARILKEQFVMNVSHELRTPLNLVVGFAEMMYLAPESYGDVRWTPEIENDIEEMYRASQHLQSLVNDILDLSRIDATHLPMYRELQDIREIITEAAETIAPLLRQRRLSYDSEWPDDLPQLFVDRIRIRQVMLNLLSNAVRFTDQGGITVKVEQTPEAIVVSVHDTGIGIPEDQLETIFEKFRPLDAGLRRRGGTGLGLALCRQFIGLHGGRTWVESKVNAGSTFYFSLPLPGAIAQTIPLQRTPEPRRVIQSNEAVVVIDPDPSVADMLSRYLGDHPILSARNASEAEELIESEHPLAVIVNLPPKVPQEAWLGPLGQLSERYCVPIMRCSIPSPSWLQQSTGVNDCLTKPVARESLRRIIERYCPGPGTILVVDDEPGFVTLMARMLRTMGQTHEVIAALTGAQALRYAHERKPNMILLDLLLPDMHGLEVIHAVRDAPALDDTVIIVVTATSFAEEALLGQAGHFTLTQSAAITAGTLAKLLHGLLQIVRPNYVDGEEIT